MIKTKPLFTFAAYLSFAVAIFQAGISFSPSLSQFFGAPEQLVAKPLVLVFAGLFMAVVFGVFGLYALSGAGVIRRLPFLRVGLSVIGGIYTLRGLMLVPELMVFTGAIRSSEIFGIQSLVSSSVALFIGLVYLIGTLGVWQSLSFPTQNQFLSS